MSYAKKLLASNEAIVRTVRPHWVALLPTILVDLAISIVIIGLSVAGIILAPPFTWFGLLLLLVPVGHFLSVWWVWHNREVVVTDRRIIQVAGLINKQVSDTLLEKINDIITRQTGMGRLLNYGDVEIISGSDSGADTLRRISDPVGFKKTLLEQKGPAGSAVQPATVSQTNDDVPALIRELAELREKGVLTDAEFAQKKRELLDRI